MLGSLRHVFGYGLVGLCALARERDWRVTEWADRTELDRLQAVRLRHLLTIAGKTPYWQDLLRGKPSHAPGESARAQLATLPILTKAMVREQGRRMLMPGPKNGVHWCTTGGSTGEPLRVAKNLSTRVAAQGGCLRGLRWLGINPGDPTILVKGFDQIRWLGKLRCHALNIRLADPLSRDPAAAAKILKLIQDFSPRCLIGYPTYLLKLAEMAAAAGLHVPVIACTGEMLYPGQRKILETVFSARVAEYYGSNEVSGIAFECEHGRKHITEEHVILETVDDAGKPVWEQPGRILVTDLDNHVMPLIRYELGDMGVLTRESCPCGRSLLGLKALQGRLQDCLQNACGEILPAMHFAELSRHLTSILSYQLVQLGMDEIHLRYVPNGRKAEAEAESIRASIRKHLGAEMRVTSEVCRTIELTPRGKTRLVVGLNSNAAPN